MMNYIGIDIGGTSCRVSVGSYENSELVIHEKSNAYVTKDYTPIDCITNLINEVKKLQEKYSDVKAIGISCGGPLNSVTGRILSPPNLIGWDDIAIVEMVKQETGLPVYLCNDANACALLEWMFGAGEGSKNMAFLTFGTGMGAGLILNERLYVGTSDMAGEVGHIRLSEDGPTGYGKRGSFEGFCSGGGIAQIAKSYLLEAKQQGKTIAWDNGHDTSAKDVATAAQAGDELAITIMKNVSYNLGRGLSLLIDILNLDTIVIGSIYQRNEEFMKPYVEEVIKKECLSYTADVVELKASTFADSIGDYAAICVAMYFEGGVL